MFPLDKHPSRKTLYLLTASLQLAKGQSLDKMIEDGQGRMAEVWRLWLSSQSVTGLSDQNI
jgi:hypothetical protein